ncbi:hypothetical protein EV363DRAFT_1413860 [Boletus edulis]|nr:hypothetical protein EV363DRAFT_1413860 [Boletus edulis]
MSSEVSGIPNTFCRLLLEPRFSNEAFNFNLGNGFMATPSMPVHRYSRTEWWKHCFASDNMVNGRYITALNNHLQGRNELHLLSWKQSHEGPANALVWTMECKVGGQVLGSASAGQVQTAKEQAAQSACRALGISA